MGAVFFIILFLYILLMCGVIPDIYKYRKDDDPDAISLSTVFTGTVCFILTIALICYLAILAYAGPVELSNAIAEFIKVVPVE